MSAALAQLTELQLETYNVAANLNIAPIAANLNRVPHLANAKYQTYNILSVSSLNVDTMTDVITVG